MPQHVKHIPTKNSAAAFAPATVANLGPGFDILGLALDSPGDTVTVEHSDTLGVQLGTITGDGGALPADPLRNTACVAAHHVLQAIAQDRGIVLHLDKGMPLASGLGSSSASAAAGAVATNALFGNPLSRAELLPACIEAEAVVSGRHADNVAPALLGGVVLVTGITADSVYRLPVPDNLHLAVVSPEVEVPTAQARAALPATVPLGTMVHQTAQVALLVHALHSGDVARLAAAVGGDQVVEPARAHLMPHLREAQAAARAAGALTTIISGAGPTVCALCDSGDIAQQVASALQAFYHSKNIEAAARATTVAAEGAVVLTRN
jgi:homoserine kinase